MTARNRIAPATRWRKRVRKHHQMGASLRRRSSGVALSHADSQDLLAGASPPPLGLVPRPAAPTRNKSGLLLTVEHDSLDMLPERGGDSLCDRLEETE